MEDERKAKIRLKTFQEAKQVAIQLQSLFAKDVVIVHDKAGFSLQCSLSLDEEFQAYEKIASLSTQTREKKPITKEEDNLVAIDFTHWNSVEAISHKIKRPQSSVTAILRKVGLWLDFDPPATPPPTPSPPITYENGLLEILDAGLIGEITPELRGQLSEGSYENLSRLSSSQLKVIAAIMMSRKSSYEHDFQNIINLAIDAGMHELSYHLVRLANQNPVAGFNTLKMATGLSPLLLYQREVLRAFASQHLLDYFPKKFLETRCSTKLYAFGEEQFSHISDDLLALIHPNDKKLLGKLVSNGCRLAAWLLSEIFDKEILAGGNYRGSEAEHTELVRGGLVPSAAMISDILRSHIKFDAGYAGLIRNVDKFDWQDDYAISLIESQS